MKRPANPFKREFSATRIEEYLDCPRKYFYKEILLLLPLRKSTALSFGSAIHAAVAEFYKNRTNPDVLLLAEKAFIVDFARAGVSDEKRNAAAGLIIVRDYIENYKNDSFTFIPELIEVEQKLLMENGTFLFSTIDRVKRDDKFVSFIDSKTTSMPFTDYYWKSYENSFQMGAYWNVISNICGRCDSIEIDGISTDLRKKKEERFARKSWVRSDLQQEEWYLTYLWVTDQILQAMEGMTEDTIDLSATKKFPCNNRSCSDYGGCEYMPICIHGATHPAMKVDFQIKKREEL